MNENTMTGHSRTDWARVDAMTDEEIDYSDSPPLTEAMLSRMKIRYPSPVTITLDVDPKTAAWFEEQGESAQQQMAAALRIYAEAHTKLFEPRRKSA